MNLTNHIQLSGCMNFGNLDWDSETHRQEGCLGVDWRPQLAKALSKWSYVRTEKPNGQDEQIWGSGPMSAWQGLYSCVGHWPGCECHTNSSITLITRYPRESLFLAIKNCNQNTHPGSQVLVYVAEGTISSSPVFNVQVQGIWKQSLNRTNTWWLKLKLSSWSL